MANRVRSTTDVDKILAENERLKSENTRLTKQLQTRSAPRSGRGERHAGRTAGVILLSVLAALLLLFGNVFFWTGNTIVKTDRYVDAVDPLIREPSVQKAVSTYASEQFLRTVDVEQVVEQSLPPRASFLAPTLTDQVQQNSEKVIAGILQKPGFQEKWNTAQAQAHTAFINQVKTNGSDGTIDLNDLYTQQISPHLKQTKLSFLADKPLPAKVGTITVAEGRWVARLSTLINNIDLWRAIAIGLLLIFSAAAIWLSRNRRKTLIRLGLLFAAAMFVTLIAVRLARVLVSNRVDVQFADAASQTTQTLLHPLALQSALILALAVLISFIAWVSGPSRGARRVSGLFRDLLSGRLHGALFKQENRFTLWVDRHKALLQWAAVAAVAIGLLIVDLTPNALLWAALLILVLVVIIEALGARSRPASEPT